MQFFLGSMAFEAGFTLGAWLYGALAAIALR